MINKRLLISIFTIFLAVTAVAGCGKKETVTTNSDDSTKAAAVDTSATPGPTPLMDGKYDDLGVFVSDTGTKDEGGLDTSYLDNCYVFAGVSPTLDVSDELATLISEKNGITITVTLMSADESDNVNALGNVITPVKTIEPTGSDTVYSIIKTEVVEKGTVRTVTISFDVKETQNASESTLQEAIEAYDIDISGTTWSELGK